jgi:hypothetical protein
MKKNTTFLFLTLALFAISISSCVSTHKGFQSSPVMSRNVELDPIKADIKVNESSKLTGQSSSTYLFCFRLKGDNTVAEGINYSTETGGKFNPIKMMKIAKMNKVRSAAAYKAISGGDYDLLVHPNFAMTSKNYFGIIKIYDCTVTGYGAKYQNFRTEKQKVVIIDGGKEYVFPEK